MGRLSGFKYREIIQRLRRFGFAFHRSCRGQPRNAGDVPEGTLRAILRQAGIDPNDFLRER
jgi:predicted RNA binding protein YcfA (HicA-like mRNA interferase family)